MGRIEVEMRKQPLGECLDVPVDQEQEARPGREHEKPLGGLKEGDGSEPKSGAIGG